MTKNTDSFETSLPELVSFYKAQFDSFTNGKAYRVKSEPETLCDIMSAICAVWADHEDLDFLKKIIDVFDDEDFEEAVKAGRLSEDEIQMILEKTINGGNDSRESNEDIIECLIASGDIERVLLVDYVKSFEKYGFRHRITTYEESTEYIGCALTLEVDEPFIHIGSDGYIYGYWGNEEYRVPLSCKAAAALDQLMEKLFHEFYKLKRFNFD